MDVTLSGIVILVRPEQSLNVESPIYVTPLGIDILVSVEQLQNAYLPIFVKLSGKATFARFEHEKNA